MTSEQLIQIGGMLLTGILGALVHRYWPASLSPSPSPSPSPLPAVPSAHDRPLANLLMQLLAMIAGGQVAVPMPAVPMSPTPLAPGSGAPTQAAGSGSPASVILLVNGQPIVLPIDPSAFGQPKGAAAQPAPAT